MTLKIDIYKTGSPSERGFLGYYDLIGWWETSFSPKEKIFILEKYKPMGSNELIEGTVTGSSATVVNFLIGLQSWFTKLADESISEKILIKAESLLTDETPILDRHFLYGCFIEHYYKKRNIDFRFYDLAKQYCMKQISISQEAKGGFLSDDPPFPNLPRHKGYEQLAIILEKEKKYNDALSLCLEAKEIGWNTDWDKRILALEKKMSLKS